MMANRYQELLDEVPTGRYYDALGDIYPLRDTATEFRFETNTPNTRYGVFDNGSFRRIVDTNAVGVAIVEILLEQGEHELILVNQNSQAKFRAWITVRSWATWMAAHADIFDALYI
jgi:hypothetical protein